MNRLPERKTQDETWAHYIKRRVGEKNFNGFNDDVLFLENRLSTQNDLEAGGLYFYVGESVDLPEKMDSFRNLVFYTRIGIGNSDGDYEPKLSANIYENDRVEIDDNYDPLMIPPNVIVTIESYRDHEDVHKFVDDIIDLVKKAVDTDRRSPPPRRQ